MEPAVVLLIVFLGYSVLLGVCLARMRAINRELDTLRSVVLAVGQVQRDAQPKQDALSPEAIDALIRGLGASGE